MPRTEVYFTLEKWIFVNQAYENVSIFHSIFGDCDENPRIKKKRGNSGNELYGYTVDDRDGKESKVKVKPSKTP